MSVQKKLVKMDLDKLIPYKNNPRKNEQAVPDTVESIKQCENLDPIEIDENNVILSGHTRLEALKKLGYKETEVIQYTGLTEEQKKKYRLLTNKTGERSEWDLSKLDEELKQLDFDGFDFGFETSESLKDDDPDIKTVELKPYTKVHYLISLDINDNDKVIDYIDKIRKIGGIDVESTSN